MAEALEDSEVKETNQNPQFLEVLCKSSGKIRRFSAGTEAGFAVDLINKKYLSEAEATGVLLATYIEAIRGEEEEPVSFGPRSLLVHYGSGWKLQTVTELYGIDGKQEYSGTRRSRATQGDDAYGSAVPKKPGSGLSAVYFGENIAGICSDICIWRSFHLGAGKSSPFHLLCL